jgi:hypothetical protein
MLTLYQVLKNSIIINCIENNRIKFDTDYERGLWISIFKKELNYRGNGRFTSDCDATEIDIY